MKILSYVNNGATGLRSGKGPGQRKDTLNMSPVGRRSEKVVILGDAV